jgi:hypothetical protein
MSHAAPSDHGISSQLSFFHHLMHSIIHRITFQDQIKERDLRPLAAGGAMESILRRSTAAECY